MAVAKTFKATNCQEDNLFGSLQEAAGRQKTLVSSPAPEALTNTQ